MKRFDLYAKGKNNTTGNLLASCWAHNLVDAKAEFENKGFAGAYLLGTTALRSVIPVILRKL